jgi:hypothetical protein
MYYKWHVNPLDCISVDIFTLSFVFWILGATKTKSVLPIKSKGTRGKANLQEYH